MMPTFQRSRQPERPAWSQEQLLRERAVLLGYSVAASTNLTYDSALASYTEFCHKHNFPLEPTVDTLSFYITFMSHHVKPSTISSYLSGITKKLSPFFPSVQNVRGAPLVKKTLQGAYRLRSTPISRKRTITPRRLRSLPSTQVNPSHDHRLFLAMTWTGWHALLRTSDLADADRIDQRDARRTMLRSSVTQGTDSIRITLPMHKADQNLSGHDIVLQRVDSFMNPIDLFQDYLSMRDSCFSLCPELWLRQDGSVPTYSWFVKNLKHHLGNDRELGGSSMRSGGADYLASIGTPHSIIQAVGRWSSEAYKVYLRQHPTMVQSNIWGRPLFAGSPNILPPPPPPPPPI